VRCGSRAWWRLAAAMLEWPSRRRRGERRNFHRSAGPVLAARGHAGHIIRRYEDAGHNPISGLCRIPGPSPTSRSALKLSLPPRY
jgi:hypothetical protein